MIHTAGNVTTVDNVPVELHSNCQLVFCVPVYDESTDSIVRLLSSLASQLIPQFTIAVVLVVNNRPVSGSAAGWQQAYERNQAVLGLPIYKNRPSSTQHGTPAFDLIRNRTSTFAVDHSSPGRWVSDSNVGRARGAALQVAVQLFKAVGRNGIVVHTDADCWFEDPQFAAKLLWLFRDPALIGLTGANYQQVDPEDPESAELAQHLEAYIRYRRYRALAETVRRGHATFNAEKTLGRCIAHRTFEGVLCGGFAPIPFEEDIDFGKRLRRYGEQNNMRFEHGRQWGIGPISAMRVSDRTPNSIRKDFLDRLNPQGRIEVEDVLSTPSKQIVLTEDYLLRLANVVESLPGGGEQLEYLFVTSSLATIRVKR